VPPPALARRPQVDPWAEPYWLAFLALSHHRPLGVAGASPIPVGEIRAWLDEEGIADPVARGEFRAVLAALDAAWLAHHRSKEASPP